jgi:integrase
VPHFPKPYYRSQRGTWCVQIKGKQITLGADKEAAWAEYHRLMLDRGHPAAKRQNLTVVEACDLWLDQSKAVHQANTYATNRWALQQVTSVFGTVKVTELKVSAVERWLAGAGLRSSTKRNYLIVLRTALRWCQAEGYIQGEIPVLKIKLPESLSRTRTIAPEEREKLLKGVNPELRRYLIALGESGARPSVIWKMEAKDIDWKAGTATVISKRRPYTVQITTRLAEMLRELEAKNPTGALFRSPRGRPWTAANIRAALREASIRLGIKPTITAYSFRHSYVTDALERGLNPSIVAALVNHKDLTMISQHYNHLAERREALRKAAEDAAGSFSASTPEPSPDRGKRRRAPR